MKIENQGRKPRGIAPERSTLSGSERTPPGATRQPIAVLRGRAEVREVSPYQGLRPLTMEMRGKRVASSNRSREAAFGLRIAGPWKDLLREEGRRATSKVPPGSASFTGGRSSRWSHPERGVTLDPKRSKGRRPSGLQARGPGSVRERRLRPCNPLRPVNRPRGRPQKPRDAWTQHGSLLPLHRILVAGASLATSRTASVVHAPENQQNGSGKQPPRVQEVFPGRERENG
jgi:hypothetical protein